jgi:hypothetical protein
MAGFLVKNPSQAAHASDCLALRFPNVPVLDRQGEFHKTKRFQSGQRRRVGDNIGRLQIIFTMSKNNLHARKGREVTFFLFRRPNFFLR